MNQLLFNHYGNPGGKKFSTIEFFDDKIIFFRIFVGALYVDYLFPYQAISQSEY